MKKETDFIQEQDTPKFADVFFELFIALVPFFFISLISYLPIQLPLLHIRTHHEHLFLCIVNADSYRA